MIYLKKANFEDAEKEYLFVKDMPVDENGLTNKWNGISREEFLSSALPEMIAFSEGRELPDGYVPETFFFLWDDGEIVGQFRLRHCLCDSLRKGAGHIGYFVKKEYRGRGYGNKGLGLLLKHAKDVIPESEVYLRVNKDNPASLRVILKNGAYIDHEDENKYYLKIKKSEL